jgi:enhancing lycopene biosynthesis protein 2
MKYVLIIWVCSFIQGNACMAPMEYPTVYNSWYECTRDAHVESVKLLSKMGYAHVNKYQLGTKYNCRGVYTY